MNLCEILAGLPKTIYLNFKQLPVKQAIHLPILVSWRTHFKSLKGKIRLEGKITTGMVRIGLNGSGSGTCFYMATVLENNGTLVFKGPVKIGGGCQICTVLSDSLIEIGSDTKFMGESHVIAEKKVSFGQKCAISWNTQIMDTDFHKIYDECIHTTSNSGKKRINESAPILIGDHVWIASHVCVMKGAKISDNSVVACGSIINGREISEGENNIVTGLPNRVLKRNIQWEM